MSKLRKWWMTVAFVVLVATQSFVAVQAISARHELNRVIADAAAFTKETCQNRQDARLVVRSVMFQFIETLPVDEGKPIQDFIENKYPPISCP
jgi:hypothetical protein